MDIGNYSFFLNISFTVQDIKRWEREHQNSETLKVKKATISVSSSIETKLGLIKICKLKTNDRKNKKKNNNFKLRLYDC